MKMGDKAVNRRPTIFTDFCASVRKELEKGKLLECTSCDFLPTISHELMQCVRITNGFKLQNFKKITHDSIDTVSGWSEAESLGDFFLLSEV
jgi:hypothetical protein